MKQELIFAHIGQSFDLNDKVTTSEALKAAKCDYVVTKQPLFVASPEIQSLLASGESIPAPLLQECLYADKVATYRADYGYTLGIVGKDYGVTQNSVAFEFCDELANGRGYVSNAGYLGGGEQSFVCIKLNDSVFLDDRQNDKIELYLCVSTTHDGSGSFKVFVAPLRVFCNNMVNLAFHKAFGSIALRHTSKIGDRVERLRVNRENTLKTLKMSEAYANEFQQAMSFLKGVHLTQTQVHDIIAHAFLTNENYKAFVSEGINSEKISTKSRNIFANVLNACESGVGQSYLESGSGLWLLNGATTYFQNEKSFSDGTQKFLSLTSGNSYRTTNKVFELIQEIA